jgi:hypothetical protein
MRNVRVLTLVAQSHPRRQLYVINYGSGGQITGMDSRLFLVSIIPISKGDEEPGIRNALHERVSPFHLERSVGPRTVPAKRMKA